MNTILLQKILDILKEGLAHVGDFFKDLFISDPQDGQVIAYDADTGHWVNKDATEVELDLTNTFEAQAIATLTDGAENVPMKSLIVDIVPKETGTGTKSPSNPYTISGTDEVVITHTYGDNETDTHTIALPSTVYGGEVDVVSGMGENTFSDIIDLSELSFNYQSVAERFVSSDLASVIKKPASNVDTANINCSMLATTYANNTSVGGLDNSIAITTTGNIVIKATSAGSSTTDLISLLENSQFVYELATPTPITITPTPIKTQGGTESIFADSGNVSGEYYTKTAGDIKTLVCFTEDITSQVTKNTTDFSDILLKVSQNNKVVSVEIYSATTSAAVNETFISGLPKPAMNCKVLLANTTLGEDGTILGTLKTSGELEIATSGAKTFSGLITYVAK